MSTHSDDVFLDHHGVDVYLPQVSDAFVFSAMAIPPHAKVGDRLLVDSTGAGHANIDVPLTSVDIQRGQVTLTIPSAHVSPDGSLLSLNAALLPAPAVSPTIEIQDAPVAPLAAPADMAASAPKAATPATPAEPAQQAVPPTNPASNNAHENAAPATPATPATPAVPTIRAHSAEGKDVPVSVTASNHAGLSVHAVAPSLPAAPIVETEVAAPTITPVATPVVADAAAKVLTASTLIPLPASANVGDDLLIEINGHAHPDLSRVLQDDDLSRGHIQLAIPTELLQSTSADQTLDVRAHIESRQVESKPEATESTTWLPDFDFSPAPAPEVHAEAQENSWSDADFSQATVEAPMPAPIPVISLLGDYDPIAVAEPAAPVVDQAAIDPMQFLQNLVL